MKTFIVQGSNWFVEIEIDNNLIDKDIDMGCEAATQALELYLSESREIKSMDDCSPALAPFMIAQEKGNDNEDDNMIFLTEHICRNAGKHSLADTVNKLVEKHYNEGGDMF